MKGLIPLFPTLIYRDPALVSNYDLVQREVKSCLDKILNEDDLDEVSWLHEEAGKRREAKRDEYHDYLIYDDLVGKFNLVNLKERIHTAVDRYVRMTQWSRIFGGRLTPDAEGKFDIVLRNSWINIQSKRQSHEWHCHPGYTIAGVYYMRVSADQGGIQFQNPNIMMQNCWFPENPRASQSIEIIPDDGDIILFPAWLMHNTMQNTTDEDRISVAFNIDIRTGVYQDDPGNGVQDFTGKSVRELIDSSQEE
tara:strand:+ start:373 stop:1125 length:753 start_codon:yes stop_codon:yes gene_type:complete